MSTRKQPIERIPAEPSTRKRRSVSSFLPFAVTLAVYLTVIIIWGTFYESYEDHFSTLIQGLYTSGAAKDWLIDQHFIILPLFSTINSFIPTVQVYGVLLTVANFIALSLLVSLIFEYADRKNAALFGLLFLIVCIENIVNLNTTRIVLTSMGVIMIRIAWTYSRGLVFSKTQWGIFAAALVILSLMRFPAVLLACIIFLLLSLFHRSFHRVKKPCCAALGIAVLIFVIHTVSLTLFADEAMKVFYRHEIDYYERINYDTDRVAEDRTFALEVMAIGNYHITDTQHYTFEFAEKLLHRSSFSILLNGLNYQAYMNTLRESLPFYYSLWYLLTGAFVMGGLSLLLQTEKRRQALGLLFFMGLPLLLCFYIATPRHFLGPYYVFLMAFYVDRIIRRRRDLPAFTGLLVQWGVGMILLFILIESGINAVYTAEEYKRDEQQFRRNIELFHELNERYERPVVMDSVLYTHMFPVDPLRRVKPPEVLIMNHYLLVNAFPAYRDTWARYCENPLSLKEKFKVVADNNLLYVLSDANAQFLPKYFAVKYNMKLKKLWIADFDDHHNVYIVNYEEGL